MITVFQMETGEILKCGKRASTTTQGRVTIAPEDRRQVALALQEIPFAEARRPVARMPPEWAEMDVALILSRYRGT